MDRCAAVDQLNSPVLVECCEFGVGGAGVSDLVAFDGGVGDAAAVRDQACHVRVDIVDSP